MIIKFKHLDEFQRESEIHDPFQSGSRQGHGAETAVIKIINDPRVSLDNKNDSVLMLLESTAAFDTVGHKILSDRIQNWIVLKVHFQTALTLRKQKILCKPQRPRL